MSVTEVYLDTNLIIGLITLDPSSAYAEAVLSINPLSVFVSDLALAECASVLARRMRMKELTKDEVEQAFHHLDTWISRSTNPIVIQSSDIADATRFIRRLDVNLRLQDAIHIAATIRTGTVLATLDVKMAECAKALGCPVLDLPRK
jgi:predicted nucleic acid-binding protein